MQGQEEPVVVLVLGRAPKTGVHAVEKFRDLLLECSALRPCREAMASFNKPCELDSGALIFVDPQMYDHTIDALERSTLRARRWMVIIASKYESTIRSELAQLPFKLRPKVRNSRSVLLAPNGAVFPKSEQQQQHHQRSVLLAPSGTVFPTPEQQQHRHELLVAKRCNEH